MSTLEKKSHNYSKIFLLSSIFLFSFFLLNKTSHAAIIIDATNQTNTAFDDNYGQSFKGIIGSSAITVPTTTVYWVYGIDPNSYSSCSPTNAFLTVFNSNNVDDSQPHNDYFSPTNTTNFLSSSSITTNFNGTPSQTREIDYYYATSTFGISSGNYFTLRTNCAGAGNSFHQTSGSTNTANNTIWNGTTYGAICTGTDFNPITGCNPPPSTCDDPVNIDIISPASTSTIVNDFANFNVSTTLQEAGGSCAYGIKLTWGVKNNPGQQGFITQTFQHIYPDSNNGNWLLPKNLSLWGLYEGTTTQFTEIAQVFDPTNGVVLGSSNEYNFYLTANAGSILPNGYNPNLPCGGLLAGCGETGTPNYVIPTSSILTASSTPFCSATSSDWATQTISWLFCLQPFATGALQGTWQGVQSLPVLDVFTNLNGVIQNEVSINGELLIQPSGTPSVAEQYQNLGTVIPFFNSNQKLMLITSSTGSLLVDSSTILYAKRIQDFFFTLSPVALTAILFL